MTEAPYRKLFNDPKFFNRYFLKLPSSLKDQGHWLTQEDIANIARVHYNWNNDENSEIYFDVIGSAAHLETAITNHLPRLENGNVKSLTFIVNLGANHWTSLVVAKRTGRLHAFYADSFGPPTPGAVTIPGSSEDGRILSLNTIRYALQSIRTQRNGEGIDFVDVSAMQQADSHSCGLFSMSNAQTINMALRDRRTDNAELRKAISEARINPKQLRQEFAFEIAGHQFNNDPDRDEPDKELDFDDQDFYSISDNEYDPGPIEAEEDIGHAVRNFDQNQSYRTFSGLITAFLTNTRSFRSTLFKKIIDTTNNLEALKKENTEAERILLFTQLTDIIEECPDPNGFIIEKQPPKSFVETVVNKAVTILGQHHPLTLKLKLLKIFLAKNRAEAAKQFLREGYDLDAINDMFQEQVPRPTTGIFYDDNINDDRVREVRYLYVLGLIFAEAQKPEQSIHYLEKSKEISMSIQAEDVNGVFFQRRGDLGLTDLHLIHNRVNTLLTHVHLENDNLNDAMGTIREVIESDSQNRARLMARPGYISFLDLVDRAPADIDIDALTNLFETKPRLDIPMDYIPRVTEFIRVLALTPNLLESKQGLKLLEAFIGLVRQVRLLALVYTDQAKSTIYLEESPGKNFYDLAETQLRFGSTHSPGKPGEYLDVLMKFIKLVKSENLEDYADEGYSRALKHVVDILHWLHAKGALSGKYLKHVKEVASFFIREFGIDSKWYQGIVPELYDALAKFTYSLTSMREFVMNAFYAHYVSIYCGRDAQVTADDKHLIKVRDLLLQTLEERNEIEAAEVVSLQFRGLQELVDAQYWEAGKPSASGVKPLKTLTREYIMDKYILRLEAFNREMQRPVIQNALDHVGDIIKAQRDNNAPQNEQDANECPPRQKRMLGLCFDTKNQVEDDEMDLVPEEREKIQQVLGNHEQKISKLNEFFETLNEAMKTKDVSLKEMEAMKDLVNNLPENELKRLDVRMKTLTESIKRSNSPSEINSALKRRGVADGIQSSAEKAGLIFTGFLVTKHLLNKDLKGLGYDALNLYLMPKLGEQMSTQLLKAAAKYNSRTLSLVAPVIGRGLGNFAAFLGLYQSIKARMGSKSDFEKEIADVNIASNSIFIAADVPALATELASSIGVEVGLIGEFAGPVGLAVSVAAIVVSQIVEAALQVDNIGKQIELTASEKNSLFWRFTVGQSVPEYLKEDIYFEKVINSYLTNVIEQYGEEFNSMTISTPKIVRDYVNVRKGGKSIFFNNVCSDREILQSTNILPTEELILLNSDLPEKHSLTRIFPQKIGNNHRLVCGPVGDGNVHEKTIVEDVKESNPTNTCIYNSTEILLAKIKRQITFGAESNQCRGATIYEKEVKKSADSTSNLYFLNANSAAIWESKPNMTVVFTGKQLTMGESSQAMESNLNRYHVNSNLEECTILSQGTNFIYTNGNSTECSFQTGSSRHVQTNIVFSPDAGYKDSLGIDGILGGPNSQKIEVGFAQHVDGMGGGDTILLNSDSNTPIVQTYVGDTVTGKKGVVILPFNLKDITVVTLNDEMITFKSEDWTNFEVSIDQTISGEYKPFGLVNVHQGLRVLTKDNLFVTPVRSQSGREVTHLQVMIHKNEKVYHEVALEILRNIKNEHFVLTKQFNSLNTHITLAESGNYLFHGDGNHKDFIWEGKKGEPNYYIVGNKGQYIINNGNGIVDLSNLSLKDKLYLGVLENKSIILKNNHLTIELTKNYQDLQLLLPNKRYYKLVVENQWNFPHSNIRSTVPMNMAGQILTSFNGMSLVEETCTNAIEVEGNLRIDLGDLLITHNCLDFSKSGNRNLMFLQSHEDLFIIGSKGRVLLENFYAIQEPQLTIKLEDKVLKPFKVNKLAKTPTKLSYHLVSQEQSMTMFINQPIDMNSIHIIYLKDVNLSQVEISPDDADLIMVLTDEVSLTLKNWKKKPEARRAIFYTDDEMLMSCSLGCRPQDLERELDGLKLSSLDHELTSESPLINENPEEKTSSFGVIPSLFNFAVNETLLLTHYALSMFSKDYQSNLPRTSTGRNVTSNRIEALDRKIKAGLKKYEDMNLEYEYE